MSVMDFIFLLDEGHRAAFLHHVIQSFGCSYICLWSQLTQPANCLYFLDGIYQETSSQQPSSSSGSHARRLFNAYSESINYIDSGRIPGYSFKNNLPYLEFKIDELQRNMASSEVQLQFYQEAKIKTAVFMGCANGVIEIGMLHQPKANLEIEIKNVFPMEFSREIVAHPQPADQIWPSSSSSSLRSLSFDSPEYSPLVFSIPTTSPFQAHEPTKLQEAVVQESFVVNTPKPVPYLVPNTSYIDPHQETMQALRQIRDAKFPTIESEDDAIQKAILVVLSSPSSTNSSSNSQQNPLNLPSNVSLVMNKSSTAFRRYTSSQARPLVMINRKHNMFKRAVVFLRNLNMMRRQEYQIQENRPTATRLHHTASERKRREKFNEVFQVLRSLLPAGSRKDKASVLSSTTQYVGSLISKVSELSKRNQELEASHLNQGEAAVGRFHSAQDQRLNVEINQVSERTSEERFWELIVTVRGESSMLDLVIRILESIKQQNNVGLLSLKSNTSSTESTSVHCVVLRLKIEGDESDESRSLKERVTKALNDVAR